MCCREGRALLDHGRRLPDDDVGDERPAFAQANSEIRTLKELARSYMTLTEDVNRVMNRIRSVYRSQAIAFAGPRVIPPTTVRSGSISCYSLASGGGPSTCISKFYLLQPLRLQARHELLKESHKYPARATLQKISWVGPIRAALLIALVQTPHRLHTKRLFWAYIGLAVETHSSADYQFKNGELQRSKKNPRPAV